MTNEEARLTLQDNFGYLSNEHPRIVEALKVALDILSKSELPTNLDEAAEKEVEHFCSDIVNIDSVWANMPLTKKFGLQMFKAGAEWMAGQGVIYDCRCVEVFQRAVGGAMNAQFPFKDLGLKDGDEVIIQIRKK